MIRLALIAIGGVALTGCVSTSSTQWADKRCAEVAPNYDRTECIAAYVEARTEARAVANLTEDAMFHDLREDDANVRQRGSTSAR